MALFTCLCLRWSKHRHINYQHDTRHLLSSLLSPNWHDKRFVICYSEVTFDHPTGEDLGLYPKAPLSHVHNVVAILLAVVWGIQRYSYTLMRSGGSTSILSLTAVIRPYCRPAEQDMNTFLNTCGICGGESGNGTHFLRILGIFHCQFHLSTIHTRLSIHPSIHYRYYVILENDSIVKQRT